MSIRAAFYYPWFPETWGSGTIFQPSLGAYKSELGIIQTHVAEMRYSRHTAAIASWWGPGTPYDSRIATCLQAAEGTAFKWCVYHEMEGYKDPSVSLLRDDLAYLQYTYAQHRNYLRINRKPVIFVYAGMGDGAEMTDRWQQASGGAFHICQKIFPGFMSSPSQPDSWHEYAPAAPVSNFSPLSFSVSPGFAKPGEDIRLPRDPARFRANVKAMDDSEAFWKLTTTFNEWGEGTAVEPELGFGTTYLDILHNPNKP